MTGDRLRRVEGVFGAAVARPASERAAWVRDACGDDHELVREVESLLAAHESHDGALDVPALQGAASHLAAELLTLRPGEQLGPYEVVRLIGAGGMGEVYEARDDRLGRSVAVKVLPAQLASDPHRAWRFEQEARAAAALKHPNVVAVFDVGRHRGTPFIVSELLQGETLRQHLLRSPLAPRKAALVLAEVARGLAAAHAAGIVHRDLKPENVFLTREGPTKVLDFGVAKLMPKNPLLTGGAPTMGASLEGQVVGTIGYMAPEQVRGESVDARADLFAVGTMLYESLAGRSPFTGASAVETLNAILTVEPVPLREVRLDVSDALARVTHRCLEKAPAARFQSAADLAFALESAVGSGVDTEGRPPVAVPAAARRRPRLAWVAAAVATALGLLGAYRLGVGASPAVAPPMYRLSLLPPPGTAWASVPVVSPDGRRLAFVAVDGQQAQLYLQPTDGRVATPVPGTAGAMNPFWSPDSSRVGVFTARPGSPAEHDLRLVAPDGTLGSSLWSGMSRGAAILPDGNIVISPRQQSMFRIGPLGGSPAVISRLAEDRLEYAQRWPSPLPDGKQVLYFSWASPAEQRGVYVARLDVAPEQQQPRLLLQSDSNAVFVPADSAAPALLVFERGAVLYADRFDERSLTPSGSPVALERDVGRQNPDHAAQFSVSPQVLVTGPDVPFLARMNLVRRDGRVERTITDALGIAWPRFSPDGTSVLHGRLNLRSGDMDLWVLDLERDVSTRITAHPGFSGWPAWSPDGRQVAYLFQLYSTVQLRVRSLEDGDGAERTLDDGRNLRPTDWSPDGQWIVAAGPSVALPANTAPALPGGPRTGLDLWAVPVRGGEPVPLKSSEFNETEARVAPGGRLFAYVSDVSGRPDVYLDWFVVGDQPRPAGGPWRVSPDGGDFPVWTKGGRELVYFGADDRFYSVTLSASGAAPPRIGRPEPLTVPYGRRFFPPLSGVHYAVSADGEQLILTPERGKVTEPMRVTVNWRSLVK